MTRESSINDKFVQLMSFINLTERELVNKGVVASHNIIRTRVEYILANAITESYNLIDSSRKMLELGKVIANERRD